MKLGILSTFRGNFGQKGFYNVQEIGLAKELDKLFDEVIVYKLIPRTEESVSEKIAGCNNTTLNSISSRSLGVNGFIELNKLDKGIDVLIYFSDTQLMVPKVYKWCKRNHVTLIPYIGVAESHSDNKVKKFIINTMFKRNVRVYRKCTCVVKNPEVGNKIEQYGVMNHVTAPVGLDLSILHTEYDETPVIDLKKRWGFENSDNILLFIGRLVPEKEPVKLIEIFEQINMQNPTYKLLMVGTGLLAEEIKSIVYKKNLSASVKIIDKVPNTDIWQLYKISKAFINLNKQEIFGMAILEAMYYKCKVVALEAPGPNFIIENGVSGFLCKTDTEVIDGILRSNDDIGMQSRERIINKFTWRATANIIHGLVVES